MNGSNVKPERIVQPIQLLAVPAVLVLAFVAAALTPTGSWWYGVFAGALTIALLVIIVLMLTRWRENLLANREYWQLLLIRSTERAFARFRPEGPSRISDERLPQKFDSEWHDAELERERVYGKTEGLFIVHRWRPSVTPGQVADVTISLAQHREGPLSRGDVRHVSYQLGTRFFAGPVIKENATEKFRLDVEAFAPVLCLARVSLRDGRVFMLDRYIDFPVEE